jgi:hypothetical protein
LEAFVSTTPAPHQRPGLAALFARVALLSAASVLSGCLPIDPPDGSLVCAQPPDECPPGYACAADHTCRRPAVNGPDLGIDNPQPDLSGPADFAMSRADLGIVCPAGALLCDDFETGNFDRWSFAFLGPPHPSKILKVDSTEAHAGTHALHASVDNANEDSYLYVGWQFAPKSAPLALRMWVKPVKPLNATGMVTRLLNGTNGFQIGGDASGNWFVAQDIGASPEVHSTAPVATNQWTCLELVVDTNVQIFLDDSVSPIIDFTPSHPVSYSELHVGVEWAPKGVPVDVWIDDVAYGTSRIHCN